MTEPMAHALDGVHVVSIALNLPGPTCVRRLVEYGARVTKIEPPAELGGDPMSRYARSYYDELHHGVDVRTLHLKQDGDRATMDALLATAQLLITSQRAAAMHKLQLDWDSVSARFPLLSQVAIVGSAHDEHSGHDLTYIASAGLATPPRLPTTLVADLAGAERAVSAVFAVLRAAERAGVGQHAVVSLEESAHAFAAPFRHGLTSEGGLLNGGFVGYAYYRAQDGWIALAALEPHFAMRVMQASGVPFTAPALDAFFASERIAHWTDWAKVNDIPLVGIPPVALG